MISEKSQSTYKKLPVSKISVFSIWWAHQDLNLGPKDYEQLQEIKSYINQ
jgi:hypothetical protein